MEIQKIRELLTKVGMINLLKTRRYKLLRKRCSTSRRVLKR